MSDTENIKIGTCRVYFDGQDLGYTQGGVDVSVTTDTHEVNVDQFGKSVVNEIIQGRMVSAKVPMAETTLENLVTIMPGASIVNVGSVQATGEMTFSALPAAGDTVTVNGIVFTFQAAAPTEPGEVEIGATPQATAANMLAALQSYEDPAIGYIIFYLGST